MQVKVLKFKSRKLSLLTKILKIMLINNNFLKFTVIYVNKSKILKKLMQKKQISNKKAYRLVYIILFM